MQSETDFFCVCVMANNKINYCLGNIQINIWIRYKIRSKVYYNQTGRTKNTQDTQGPWGLSGLSMGQWGTDYLSLRPKPDYFNLWLRLRPPKFMAELFHLVEVLYKMGFLFHPLTIKRFFDFTIWEINTKLINKLYYIKSVVQGPWGQNRLRRLQDPSEPWFPRDPEWPQNPQGPWNRVHAVVRRGTMRSTRSTGSTGSII